MVNWSLRTPGSYSQLFRNNETAIYTDIDANPGTTQEDVITRTGINEQIAYTIMDVMDQQQLLVRKQGTLSILRYWTAADWAQAIISNISGVRTWIETPANEGKKVSLMSSELGINDAVAEAIVRILDLEGTIKLYEEQ